MPASPLRVSASFPVFFNGDGLCRRAIERSTIDFYDARLCVTEAQCDSIMQTNTNDARLQVNTGFNR